MKKAQGAFFVPGIEAPFSLLGGLAFLGEVPPPPALLGAALMMGAVVLSASE